MNEIQKVEYKLISVIINIDEGNIPGHFVACDKTS